MRLRTTLLSPRSLTALFTATIVLPAAALALLAWRTLEQDRELERQRIQDRLDKVATAIALGLDSRLKEISRQLASTEAASKLTASSDSLLVHVGPHGISASPPERLLYYPEAPEAGEFPSGALATPEALEFRGGDPAAAAEAYRKVTLDADPAVRAAAWAGLARCLRKSGRRQEALAAYDQLARIDAILPGGTPAGLLAGHAACRLLAEMNAPELPARAAALYRDLQQGRWRLDRASYQLHSEQVRAWLPEGQASAPDAEALAIADAVEELEAMRGRHQEQPGSGCYAVWLSGRSLLILWENRPQQLTALIAGPGILGPWLEPWNGENVAVALSGPESHAVWGLPPAPGQPRVVRSPAETGLPWTLQVASADPAKESGLASDRRRVVLAGLAVVGVLVVAGGFLVARARVGEQAVARMQSDFVAAVSHEFRSPLTSMRHLLEMLEQGAVSDDEHRRQFYRVLSRESLRLHRLVEQLLDFRRMEDPKAEYRFEVLKLSELVEQLLDFRRMEDPKAEYRFEVLKLSELVEKVAVDFRSELVERERLNVRNAAGEAAVVADREALSRALWNLLDNAAKYSPESAPIRLEVLADESNILIHVRDRGPGIPPLERKEIFRKFYRGAEARKSGTKGTGIGLAMVEGIVRAHHGEIRLDGTPGAGSTFTIVLPAVKQKPANESHE